MNIFAAYLNVGASSSDHMRKKDFSIIKKDSQLKRKRSDKWKPTDNQDVLYNHLKMDQFHKFFVQYQVEEQILVSPERP